MAKSPSTSPKPTITLDAPWSYVTPAVTIDYKPGTYTVTDAIAASWEAQGREPAEPGPLDLAIPELVAELAKIDDVEVIDAMIASETAGKTRVGAIEALSARKAELEG